MQEETFDEFGGPTRDTHHRRVRTAEAIARSVMAMKWRRSFVKTIEERHKGETTLPTFRVTPEGKVQNGAGITLPFVSIQWPGYEVIEQGEAA